ncbi:MAG TPA: hypothetical protein VN623_06070, partial [Hyphomicrobium sp.]|uniref:hypothetical protein n=1 Tax=Hyphomicrobium sp. TaxID=82 RepID=UPI002CD83EFB
MLPPHDTDDTTLAPTLSDCLLLIASGELLSHYSVKLCIELASAEALTDQSALDLGFIAGSAPNYPRAFNSYDASSAYRLFACFESGYLQGRFERERLPKFIAEKPTGCEGDEGGPSKYARLSDHIGLIFEKLGSAIDRHRDPLATNLQAIIAGSVTACALWFLAMPVTTTAEAYNFAKEASAVHKQAAASYSDDTRRSLQALIQSSLESAEVSPW